MMSKRTPIESCLLCRANPATKTNSHILSKFISTNFLGGKNQPRKGFEFSSDSALERKPRVVQDSAKESHLLCDDCEAYLSVIEGLSSDTFISWEAKVVKGEFIQTAIKDFLDIVDCNSSDPAIIRLFIYSLFWRVSISNHGLFKDYKLAVDLEDEMRQMLLTYKATTRADFLQGLATKPHVPVFPFTIITAKSFTDETANVLFAPYSYDPYSLIVDRFSFILFTDVKQMKHDFMQEFGNTETNHCRMMIFSEELWHTLMVKEPLEIVAKSAVNKKKE